jgi:MinD superfamily P-loop ATPase
VFTCCWSAKGGSGVSVVSTALAMCASRATQTVLVDLCGDLPAVLGIAEPDGPGVAEWSRDGRTLAGIVDVTPSLRLVARGRGPLRRLRSEALGELADEVVVDAGCLTDRSCSTDAGDPLVDVAARAERSLLVVRPCYLALRRAAQMSLRPHGVVVVTEPGRALHAHDVASVVGAPVIAELPFDPAIARAVDAGLLVSRCPPQMTSALEVVP